jgi:ParB family transcriptional regulator, chromosome partitioning protein
MSTKPKSAPRLGRGLSSLINVSELPIEAEIGLPAPVPGSPSPHLHTPPSGPQEIPLGAISANPHQPRREMNQPGIQALAASIRSTGLVQPIIVRRLPGPPANEPKYQLIAGERRWRAAQAANLQTIPAIFREVDSFAQAQMALIENIQREDLNPVDRAQAYRTLMDQLGLTQAELATRLGEERSTIANYLRLLDLSPFVIEMVRANHLSLGHGKLLAGVTDPKRQQELAQLALSQELSVRNLERIIETPANEPKPATPAREPSPHIRDLEKTITSTLGMRVQLRAGGQKGKGKLVIHYANLDQFDLLLERLGVKAE